MVMMNKNILAYSIDHTLLKPDATEADIRKICSEAIQWRFYSVCVNTAWVPLAKSLLADSEVKVITVAGFPLGGASREIKALEIEKAIGMGVDEVDFVQNIGLMKERNLPKIVEEFKSLVEAAQGRPLKVIIETALLTRDEKIVSCQLACEAGIAFVKTSTGFLGSGATVEDVVLMKEIVGRDAKVKASGGIRDAKDAFKLLDAGADRLGTSAGVAIMHGAAVGSSY